MAFSRNSVIYIIHFRGGDFQQKGKSSTGTLSFLTVVDVVVIHIFILVVLFSTDVFSSSVFGILAIFCLHRLFIFLVVVDGNILLVFISLSIGCFSFRTKQVLFKEPPFVGHFLKDCAIFSFALFFVLVGKIN